VHDVAVVIVNFRTKELTADAVRSVLGDPLVSEVVVVDNGSGDGSAEYVREALAGVAVIESPENIGFGRGVNLGVEATSAPFLFLLNSDAAARPGTVAALRRVLDDPTVGVVAPAVYQADGRTLQPDAHGPLPAPRARLRTTGGTPDDLEPGWVSGVAMMLRREDFTALGGFDPDFAMYLEDVDLCRRLRAAGQRVVRQPAGAVVHRGGGSATGGLARADQFHRSKAVYLRKAGAGRIQLAGAAVLRAARLAVERLRPR
jgi:N-acetylglucosaminyl-diphospho-decaprenol L-rhamnosyltransferase